MDPHDGKTPPWRFGSVAAGSETGKGCGCHGDHCPEITSVERPTMHCSRRRVLMLAVLTLQKQTFLCVFGSFSSTKAFLNQSQIIYLRFKMN